MTAALRWIALAAGAAVAAGCAAPQGNVVLLPERDGRATAVTVTQGERTVTLDQPYAAARLTGRGPEPYRTNADEVKAQFGPALAAQPAPPQQFTLYFVEGKDEFTDESKRALDGVLAEIARRPVPDVLIVGHADAVGSDTLNDRLSRQRAEVVQRALVAHGISADSIAVSGRGKRDPLVPTAEGVSEARNRRVEIFVR